MKWDARISLGGMLPRVGEEQARCGNKSRARPPPRPRRGDGRAHFYACALPCPRTQHDNDGSVVCTSSSNEKRQRLGFSGQDFATIRAGA